MLHVVSWRIDSVEDERGPKAGMGMTEGRMGLTEGRFQFSVCEMNAEWYI